MISHHTNIDWYVKSFAKASRWRADKNVFDVIDIFVLMMRRKTIFWQFCYIKRWASRNLCTYFKKIIFQQIDAAFDELSKVHKKWDYLQKVRLATCNWQMAWTSGPLLGLIDHLILTHENNCKVAVFTDYESMFWRFQFSQAFFYEKEKRRKK